MQTRTSFTKRQNPLASPNRINRPTSPVHYVLYCMGLLIAVILTAIITMAYQEYKHQNKQNNNYIYDVSNTIQYKQDDIYQTSLVKNLPPKMYQDNKIDNDIEIEKPDIKLDEIKQITDKQPNENENQNAQIIRKENNELNGPATDDFINPQENKNVKTAIQIDDDIEENRCSFPTSFTSYNKLTELTKIKIWPLPFNIDLYDYEIPIVYPIKFESNINNPILKNAIIRYNKIIFQHTLYKQSNLRNYNEEYFDSILIHIDDDDDRLQFDTDESYEIIVTNPVSEGQNCHKIFLKSSTVYGSLRGLETLSQMIVYKFSTDEYKIRLGWIQDKPKFKWRGILLDTSRHFHPPTVIKHLLDAMSYAKFNVFHWHVVDEESFPYESKVYPNLWNGSYTTYERYSENDILELIEYAKYRGIRVIPEFDTPGHAGSWCKGYDICISAPCRKPSPTLLDPSKDLTFKIIEGLIKEASERFPDDYIHLGSDEVIFDCYDRDNKVKEFLKENNMNKGHDLYKYFTDRTQKYAHKYNKKPIVWQEVYSAFGNKVPKDTIIQMWMGKKLIPDAAKNGYNILVSAGWYLDHVKVKWQDYYTNDIYYTLQDNKLQNQVIGGEACMWSEHIDLSVLDSTVWPKAAATAEKLWSHFTDLNSAFERLEYFRCLLTWRGVGGGPLKHTISRIAPDNPHSCYKE